MPGGKLQWERSFVELHRLKKIKPAEQAIAKLTSAMRRIFLLKCPLN